MRSAVEAIDARKSIAAKVRQQTDLFGHRLVGSGIYAQQGQGAKRVLRLELKMPIGQQVSSFEQIVDGQSLWMRQELGAKVNLSRVDLERVVESAGGPRAGQGSAALAAGGPWFALGGLPKLLHNLADSFQFDALTPSKLDTLDVYTMQGTWRRERLAEMFPEQKEKLLRGEPPSLGKLAEHFPERVLLVLGREDLFPYRVEYWQRKKPYKNNPQGTGYRIPLVMELFEVQFDVDLDSRGFVYKPGDLEVKDATNDFLKSVGLVSPLAEPAGASTKQPQLR